MRDRFDEHSDDFNPDRFAAAEYDNTSEHPNPEQMMVRQAAKYLTTKQKQVWELHNYDRLTQDEIGIKLGISHQAVSKHIAAIEIKIAKWCESNMGAYELLKADYGDYNE